MGAVPFHSSCIVSLPFISAAQILLGLDDLSYAIGIAVRIRFLKHLQLKRRKCLVGRFWTFGAPHQ
jgi:hypothetical protein